MLAGAFRCRYFIAACAPPQGQRNILLDGKAAIDRRDLKGVGHASADALMRWQVSYILPIEGD